MGDKFTPGPWKVFHASTVRQLGIEADDVSIIVWGNENEPDMGVQPDNDPETMWANARLIAAAPELVEALRHGVAVVRGASNEFGAHPAWDNFLMEAGSVLARIDGAAS